MRYLFLFVSCFCGLSASSQDVTQSVRGTVRNSISKQPLQGANILISGFDISEGSVSDENGRFLIENLAPGRYKMQVSFTGFTSLQEELLVIAGKSNAVSIELIESSTILSEVTFEETLGGNYNPSLTTISIEKAMRIPANFFDPVRMTTSYPSVVASHDQANAIIVKGNSPNGLLWRLNGLDIVNPNHLSNAGTLSDKPVSNGGGVNILSAQMLDKTDFFTGAFPIEYGNGLSAVLDMKLREGNKQKDEYTVQASLIGIDLAAEGPFNQKKNSSYLVNYRYSTVGLLSKLGVNFGDEDINFHDLSFNVDLNTRNGGSFSFFGMGGTSANIFASKADEDVEEDKDNYDIEYHSETYALGLNYTVPVKNTGNLFIGAGFSSSVQDRSSFLANTPTKPFNELTLDTYDANKSIFSSQIRYSFKAGERTDIQAGIITNYQNDDLKTWRQYKYWLEPISFQGNVAGYVFQPYLNAAFNIASKINLSTGVRYLHFSYNKTSSFEPRASLNYDPNAKSAFNLTYRLVSQTQQPILYLINGVNHDLELTKSHHVEAGFSRKIDEGTSLRTEVFYQHLFDVPIGQTGNFSTLNFIEIPGQFFQYDFSELVNEGTGDNYGVNITAEKSFFNNHFFIIGGSWYESKYTAADKVSRDTRFNGNYTFTGTYGKEWQKESRKRTIGMNTRILYLGGLRESETIGGMSNGGEPFYDLQNPYAHKLKDYFRIDLRISFRKDKPGYTRTFAIDIQNLTSNENEAYHYYDATQDKVVTKYQLGIIPVLVYRIDF